NVVRQVYSISTARMAAAAQRAVVLADATAPATNGTASARYASIAAPPTCISQNSATVRYESEKSSRPGEAARSHPVAATTMQAPVSLPEVRRPATRGT